MSTNEELQKLLEEKVHKSTALLLMTNTEGWEILLETFQDMKENQLAELKKISPAEKESVLTAHNIWWTVEHTLDNIITSVSSAIRDGESARQELNLITNTTEEDWS